MNRYLHGTRLPTDTPDQECREDETAADILDLAHYHAVRCIEYCEQRRAREQGHIEQEQKKKKAYPKAVCAKCALTEEEKAAKLIAKRIANNIYKNTYNRAKRLANRLDQPPAPSIMDIVFDRVYSDGPVTTKSVMESSGLSFVQARSAVHRLRLAGHIVRVDEQNVTQYAKYIVSPESSKIKRGG